MSYTETTTTSWFQRIKGALTGALIGLLLLVGGIWLLIWNEGRSVATYLALNEGAGLVVPVDSAMVDPAHDGQLIHVSGPVSVAETLQDEMFGIAVDGAVALARKVEMYQWVENSESRTEKKLGGGEETVTTYTYAKEWRDDLVDSSGFKQALDHGNPNEMPESETVAVEEARIGAFAAAGDDLADIGEAADIALSDADLQNIAASLGDNRKVTRSQDGAYVGSSASAPEIGDLRITYQRIDLATASIVAQQSGDALAPFVTSNDQEIFLSQSGTVAAADMFKSAQESNAILTWLIRAGGLLGLFIGFLLIFKICGVLGDVIPLLGSLIGFGTGIVAFALTLVIGPLAIAIGWFAYRPLLAAAVLAGGTAVAALVLYLRRRKSAAAPAAA